MNYLYLTNPVQQPVTRSFVFNKRNEKIDWRRIAAVDVDRVARELDFQVLQDNIEQIALCNIDQEVDSRAMDPNFIKLYKMAQLTIEYLLLCQEQITTQLVDYDQTKSKSLLDHEEFHRQLEKLKSTLNETKKESKKRKKTIEDQQKMLMTHQSTHYACPVCSHSFLTMDFLQAHMHRRHPEYDSNRKREHDVDNEKELQQVKQLLQTKEAELQSVKALKSADEQIIGQRDETIRELKNNIQLLTKKIEILEDKYFTLRSSNQASEPSPQRREGGVKELLKENKVLRKENEQLKQSLKQAEDALKGDDKHKRRLERDNQKLKSTVNTLNDSLQALQNASGDSNRFSEELIALRNQNAEEKNRRKDLQDKLEEANRQLAELRNQPPAIIDRKSPAPPPRSSVSPPPAPIPTRPVHQTTEILLPQYCPSLVRQINQNPQYLNPYRQNTRNQLIDELQQYENMGIDEKQTRLSNSDYQTKMTIIDGTRQNIQHDLPNFERIRAELERTVDKLATERSSHPHASGTAVRSSGGKLVTFEENSQRPKSTVNRPAMNYQSDEERSNSDEEEHTRPTKPAFVPEIQPSPRKNVPVTGVNVLPAGSMRPTTIVRPQSAIKKYLSESESESSTAKSPIHPKKPNEITSTGQKPTVSTLVQAVHPTVKTVSQHANEESDSSLTSIDDTLPQRKPSTGYVPQTLGRESINNNQQFSSADGSQYTYDSLWKGAGGKGPESRRPPTADSAKTSNMDSEDDSSEDDSN